MGFYRCLKWCRQIEIFLPQEIPLSSFFFPLLWLNLKTTVNGARGAQSGSFAVYEVCVALLHMFNLVFPQLASTQADNVTALLPMISWKPHGAPGC